MKNKLDGLNNVEKLKVLYNRVFTKDGEVKACGRYTCIDLILHFDKLEPEVSHGDFVTGFMRTTSIKNLYNRLLGEN